LKTFGQYGIIVVMLASNKKLNILCILRILQEDSDEDNPLTYREIATKMHSMYGMDCERKSVGANIDSLIDFGYDIVRLAGGGCYLREREFEQSEVTYLIDAVFGSKNISGRHAKELAAKLSGLRSKFEQRRYNYIYKAYDINRNYSKSFFHNIEVLIDAIDSGKRVSFAYGKDKRYIVNPYFLLQCHGKYYLVCNRHGYCNLSNYKIWMIDDIKILNDDVTPVSKITGYEDGLDIARYANENIYPFGDSSVPVVLKIKDWAVDIVKEWFGHGANIYTKKEDGGSQLYAAVKASKEAMVYWALQYGEGIEVMEPIEIRNKVVELIGSIAVKYGVQAEDKV